MSPVPASERYSHIDLLRGLALFGVLIVNLLRGFSVSLFQYMAGPPPNAQPLDLAIHRATAELLEFRAFALFSFLFGVGVAIQSSRIARSRVFLARRFTVLLLIGLVHIVFIWNGDILALYGVCGLLLIPFAGLPTPALVAAGVLAVLQQHLWSLPIQWPTTEAMRIHGAEAVRVYSSGSYAQIFGFRSDEALHWVLSLWISSLPRTFGIMCLGMVAWRWDGLRHPKQHRRDLLFLFAGSVVAAVLDVALELDEPVALACVYGSAALLWLLPERHRAITALGRMALTNYLAQSVILTLVFYGYGLGLFGRLSPAVVIGIGFVLYGTQAAASLWWLRRFQFGPAEWLWRSLTYGKAQPMRA